MMDCDICLKEHHAQRRPFLCAIDARNRCYPGRLENARALVENDRLQRQIDRIVTGSASEEEGEAEAPPSSSLLMLALDSSVTERRLAEDRTSQVLSRAERLRRNIAAARLEMESRRVTLARKRSDLASASDGIDGRRVRRLEEVERSALEARARWDRLAGDTTAHRRFLCSEAAKLYGLGRVARKGPPLRYEYRIGKIDAIDLTGLNALAPETISTSLAHMAHILVLASRYLGVRLPAEIAIPHRDHPRPTILPILSSYRGSAGDSSTVSDLATTMPSCARPDQDCDGAQRQTRIPRPRPLFVDKPMSVLAKEDPSAYKLFLEGVSLLAYDVAWACCSQGVRVPASSFEEVYQLGRNLHNLLLGNHMAATGSSVPDIPGNSTSGGGGGGSDGQKRGDSDTEQVKNRNCGAAMMGCFSHGTAHAFLGDAEGVEFIRSFGLPSPLKIADDLRRRLTSEMTNPDWEVLDHDDVKDGSSDVNGRDSSRYSSSGSRKDVTARTDLAGSGGRLGHAADAALASDNAAAAKNTSGWTMVRGR